MAGKMPKLIAICGEAKMYASPYGGVALFWRARPVALFPTLRGAVRYIYYEFYIEPYEFYENPFEGFEGWEDEGEQGEDDWVI